MNVLIECCVLVVRTILLSTREGAAGCVCTVFVVIFVTYLNILVSEGLFGCDISTVHYTVQRSMFSLGMEGGKKL